jgi:hypothetical protein
MSLSKIAIVALVAFSLIGCGATRQARDVEQSGFLGDYSKLEPGPDGGARLIYENPEASLQSYDKILLEPVAIWTDGDSQMNELSKEDRQMVANHLFELLHARLSQDYQIVQAPEPGTMSIAAALTSADSSNPALDTVSTIVPVGIVLSTLKAAATGKPAFVGEASLELKISDAETGELLAAAVDSRVGTKNPSGLFNKWEDVESALAYWAERLGYRLCTERGATDCTPPE